MMHRKVRFFLGIRTPCLCKGMEISGPWQWRQQQHLPVRFERRTHLRTQSTALFVLSIVLQVDAKLAEALTRKNELNSGKTVTADLFTLMLCALEFFFTY